MVANPNISDIERLFKTVVDPGYCIGCGACAVADDTGIRISLDEYGRYTATRQAQAQSDAAVSAVCPFAEGVPNEDEIAKELFENDCRYHDKIGYYLSTYAGYVSEKDFRERGSSGGMVSWILCELLSKNLVDGVLHIHKRKRTNDDPRPFHYQLSTTADEVRKGAKSRYYPVEMSKVLKLVLEHPGRYAIVGVPCFIKAVRLLMQQNSTIKERIRFCLALVCGHMKSMQYSEMLAWQCGIEPGHLHDIDFRKKVSGAGANKYGVEVVGEKDGKTVRRSATVSNLYGTDWGLGFFKYKACDYCDDVFGETADITVGDAWLPRYIRESEGTNLVVVRSPQIQEIIETAITDSRLSLGHISPDEAALSQVGGLFHRREALAYRLYLTDERSEWRPPKRVQPRMGHLNRRLKRKHSLRPDLSAKSHVAFKDALEAGDFSVFVNAMEPLVQQYKVVNKPLWKRFAWFLVLLARWGIRKLRRPSVPK